MFQGELLGIFIADRKAADLRAATEVEALAGRGLVGDRYGLLEGKNKPDREVTLIETEALAALASEYQLTLEPHQARRNLLTRKVPLNHLVGRTFRVGSVLFLGIRLCEPCGHLESLTCVGVQKGLVHRGGLRAQILQGGVMRVGAVVQLA